MSIVCVHCHTTLPDGSKFCSQCGADPSDPGSNPRGHSTGKVTDLLEQLRDAVGARYEVGRLLGRGGMGAVFMATDKTLDRPVAIKVLPPELAHDEKFVGRFEREARTAAKLDHPGIIPIYAVEHSGDLYYFVMKYVTGRSLDQILQSGPMPIELSQRILWEAACALGHAHQRGVVHRDIKPANIMIDEAGRAMLTDFGISKASHAATQFTQTGQVIGTPHYMSPEQAKGLNVDGRSDQYSLGVVGYRMFAGRLPFEDDSVHTIIYKHIFEEPTPLEHFRTDVPPFIATAVGRALAKAPDDRFAAMEEFATAIWPENPVAGPPGVRTASRTGTPITDQATQITPDSLPRRGVSGTPAGPSRAAAPKQKEKRKAPAVLLGAMVLLVLGGAAGAWWAMFGGRSAADAAPPVPAPSSAGSGTLTSPAATGQPGGAAIESTAVAVVNEPPPVERAPPPAPRRDPVVEVPRARTEPEPAPAQPAAPAVGYLTIDATPFGTVYVDGVSIGDTPIVRYSLRPGRHVIEVRREGYRTAADTLDVVAGETYRRVKTLIPEQS